MKDRAAQSMLLSALQDKEIKTGYTIIESSSGNMGIGLAYVSKMLGLKFICVTDIRANPVSIKVIENLGGKVEVVKNIGHHSDLLNARIARVKELLNLIEDSYWPNQYSNMNNADAYQTMMREIDDSIDGSVDYLFCATGTCGTIRGCSDYIKKNKLNTRVVAVDAVGSVIFGAKPGKRHIPGHGSAIRPALYKSNMADDIYFISDQSAVKGCFELRETESILAGGSTGAIVAALHKHASKIPDNSNIVLIIGDRGDRYLDTIYSNDWLISKGLADKALQI